MRLPVWILGTALLALGQPGRAEDDLARRVEQLEQRVEQLEQRVAALAAQSAGRAPEATGGALDLTLQGWSFRAVQVKFNTYYALDVALRNGYAKDIKEIEGRVQFRDLLGSHLYSIVLNKDLRLPAGQSGVDAGTPQNKRLLGEGHPLLKLKPQDVVAELLVKKLVFEDNSMLEF